MAEINTGSTVEHRFVSDNLDMLAFPAGTERPGTPGKHIMGAVVVAWMTTHPIERWGVEWARSGSMSFRFRTGLSTGTDLTTLVANESDRLLLSVQADTGVVAATAEAALEPGNSRKESVALASAPADGKKLEATPGGLDKRRLKPIEFSFDADRDLYFTQRMADGEFWRTSRWAHPAWLTGATNALLANNIEFSPRKHWFHAGYAFQQVEPIVSGSSIRLAGHIAQLFEGRSKRFAVAEVDAIIEGRVAARLTNTFAYRTR